MKRKISVVAAGLLLLVDHLASAEELVLWTNLDKLTVHAVEEARLGKARLGHRDPVNEGFIIDSFLAGYTSSLLWQAERNGTNVAQTLGNCLYQLTVYDDAYYDGPASGYTFGARSGASVVSHAAMYSKNEKKINVVEAMNKAILQDCKDTYGPGPLPMRPTGAHWLDYRDAHAKKPSSR